MIACRFLRRPIGLWVGFATIIGCGRQEPPAPTPAGSAATVQAGKPVLPQEVLPNAGPSHPSATSPSSSSIGAGSAATAPSASPTAWSLPPAVPHDYQGSWFAVTSLGAGVYVEPSFEAKKLGYLRSGGKVPVLATPVSKKNCTGGWYSLVSGGFICGNLGTTDQNRPEVKFASQPPNLEEILPYPYARNAKNGTPLYRTVPSREQMERYEPYLLEHADSSPSKSDTRRVSDSPDSGSRLAAAPAAVAAITQTPLASPLSDSGQLANPNLTPSPDPDPDKPWWQREDSKDRLHELKLQELESDADDVLAKRMVSGFYVAVDKTFRWNGRSWYKTTKGLVAPSDRFWQTSGPKFKGVELDGATWKLPVAWVYGGGRKSIGSYLVDPDHQALKNAKSFDRFDPLPLTGKSSEHGGTTYLELGDGSWVKQSQVRVTQPGPLPQNLSSGERWIDVNLTTQTLVAFVGDRPVFATMISSGKKSKIKDKDHSTPTGEWHIREKHITTTMDGDGTAAGDLPYSIEDVPYVMYFHRAYALHGAFWHNNFGVQMSHGCVNLSPLDAKYLFFFADPPIPAGFHGVWSSDSHPGTRVVIHE